MPNEVLASAAKDHAMQEAAAQVISAAAANPEVQQAVVDFGYVATRNAASSGTAASSGRSTTLAADPEVEEAAEACVRKAIAGTGIPRAGTGMMGKGSAMAGDSAMDNPQIGATRDKAMRDIAANPMIQEAAWSAGAAAAGGMASASLALAKSDMLEVKAYVQENHGSVKVLCFCIALALFLCSALGVLSIFQAVFKPFQYLLSIYNMFFALAIVIMDGKPEWYTRWYDVQKRLFQAAPILASQTGRGLFYLYVGSLNLCALPDSWFWKVVYLVLGASLSAAGVFMLIHGCRRRRSAKRASVGTRLQPV
jgi:hypothetical protein